MWPAPSMLVSSPTFCAVIDDVEQNVKVGDVLTMKAGCKHTIIADTELQVIEVQIGDEISVHDKHKY